MTRQCLFIISSVYIVILDNFKNIHKLNIHTFKNIKIWKVSNFILCSSNIFYIDLHNNLLLTAFNVDNMVNFF